LRPGSSTPVRQRKFVQTSFTQKLQFIGHVFVTDILRPMFSHALSALKATHTCVAVR